MNGYSDIGKTRNIQEDSLLLLEHSLNSNFKLLAIADGMGGLSLGAKASNLVLFELIKWFEKLPSFYYYSENNIYDRLVDKIYEMDLQIRKSCLGGGTTLAVAIVCDKNTFFVSVGDSRIYINKGGKFYQLSTDHSSSFNLYLKGQIINKEDIRFHKRNHLINSRLGCAERKLKIDKNVLYNTEYDTSILVTDGVSDCLSDSLLLDIINKIDCHTNLSKNIVNRALTSISVNDDLDSSQYFNLIEGGKDNTTAVVYSKKLIIK